MKKNLLLAVMAILVVTLTVALVLRKPTRKPAGVRVLSVTDSQGRTYSTVLEFTDRNGVLESRYEATDGDAVIQVEIRTKPKIAAGFNSR